MTDRISADIENDFHYRAMTPSSRVAVLAATAALVSFAPRARALDLFEVQVYQAEVNKPGQFGLEMHTNHTLRGQKQVEWGGHVPPDRATRVTFEPAVGVTEWLELAAYFQVFHTPEAGAQYGGMKLRAKMVVPERIRGKVMLGMNVEVGRVPRAVEVDGWANELRPILGYKNGYFLASFNPIIGYAFTGPERFRMHFEPALKGWVNTQLGFALGAEYYAGLGLIDQGFSPLRGQEHLALVAFDLAEKANASHHDADHGEEAEDDDEWELNVAFGRGFGPSTAQEWLLKTILGHSF